MNNLEISPQGDPPEESVFNSTPQQLEPEPLSLEDIYRSPHFVTVYRYENPSSSYDESREGIVSKRTLVGNWFTMNVGDLRTYIKTRQPGGKIVVVRIPSDQMVIYDATINDETREMDIEKGNFIIPEDMQTTSRLEIMLDIDSQNPKKFLMRDWSQIDSFVDSTLTPERLIERASSQGSS